MDGWLAPGIATTGHLRVLVYLRLCAPLGQGQASKQLEPKERWHHSQDGDLAMAPPEPVPGSWAEKKQVARKNKCDSISEMSACTFLDLPIMSAMSAF